MASAFFEEVRVARTNRAHARLKRVELVGTGTNTGNRINLAAFRRHDDQVVVRHDIREAGIRAVELEYHHVAIGFYIGNRSQHALGCRLGRFTAMIVN